MMRIMIGASLAAGLVATAACSNGSASTSLSPAAPSTVGLSAQRLPAATPTSTTLSDRGHGADGADEAEHGHGDESELEGRIQSVDLMTNVIVVRGITVHVLASTVIRHGQMTLTSNDLKVGTQVHVRGVRNGTAIDARLIIVQDEDNEDEDGAKAEGAVSGLTTTSTCPAITFKVGTVTIVTAATTVFRGVACAQLANGTMVEVRGSTQTNGSILAFAVKLHDDQHDD